VKLWGERRMAKRRRRVQHRLEKLAQTGKPQYPESCEEIRSFLISLGMSEFLAEQHIFTPPEHLQRVKDSYTKQRAKRVTNPLRTVQKVNLHRHVRRRQLEIQRYRCAYDHYEMNLTDSWHPRYATVEHIVRLGDGGSSSSYNTVMACSICNTLRDNKKMSAEDFYEWAQQNKPKNRASGQVGAA
jgi:hypothetical protein